MLGCRLAEANPEAGYQPIDAVADAALAEGDFAAAAVALHEFTTRVRSHLVALDAPGRNLRRRRPRSRRCTRRRRRWPMRISIRAAPWKRASSAKTWSRASRGTRVNIDRFRRALVMLGESDPDAIICRAAERRKPVPGHREDGPERGRDLRHAAAAADRSAAPPRREGRRRRRRARPRRAASPESIEIDLTDMLNDAGGRARSRRRCAAAARRSTRCSAACATSRPAPRPKKRPPSSTGWP